MKTKLNLRFSMVLLSVLLLSNSFAQKDFSRQSAYNFSLIKSGVAFPSSEKGLLIDESVSKKLLKHFNKSFKNAEGVKWEQLDDNFLATFVVNNVRTQSLFDKKGELIYKINYVSEKQLPGYIKNLVINTYRNYTITSAAGILQDNRKIWIVKLANETNYIAARIEGDDIDEIENFRKAN
ncbi:MAG TPA: hypothetical protein VIJ92_17380 [Ginsengibacter sp.]